MSSVIKVPRRPVKVAPHTVELDVKPPAPHQDSLLPKIHQTALACHDVKKEGLDVIEGNEGDFWSLICEA